MSRSAAPLVPMVVFIVKSALLGLAHSPNHYPSVPGVRKARATRTLRSDTPSSGLHATSPSAERFIKCLVLAVLSTVAARARFLGELPVGWSRLGDHMGWFELEWCRKRGGQMDPVDLACGTKYF